MEAVKRSLLTGHIATCNKMKASLLSKKKRLVLVWQLASFIAVNEDPNIAIIMKVVTDLSTTPKLCCLCFCLVVKTCLGQWNKVP